ncbi:MAG: hypothetical protein ACTTIR_06120 [Eggerthia catenaformis]|uniref:hypothetical protein n=1 Tax=Eggerthia catenaformis TaxID=31973 RepID=UPI003F9F26C6
MTRAKVKLNIPQINALNNLVIQSLEKTGEALKGEVINDQVMPFDSGNLQNESMFVDYSESNKGIVSIVSSSPYARRLYYHPEYNFNHSNNSNAKGKWFDDYQENGRKKDFCTKAFKNFLKKEL